MYICIHLYAYTNVQMITQYPCVHKHTPTLIYTIHICKFAYIYKYMHIHILLGQNEGPNEHFKVNLSVNQVPLDLYRRSLFVLCHLANDNIN